MKKEQRQSDVRCRRPIHGLAFVEIHSVFTRCVLISSANRDLTGHTQDYPSISTNMFKQVTHHDNPLLNVGQRVFTTNDFPVPHIWFNLHSGSVTQ